MAISMKENDSNNDNNDTIRMSEHAHVQYVRSML